jgi:hypothetical protein
MLLPGEQLLQFGGQRREANCLRRRFVGPFRIVPVPGQIEEFAFVIFSRCNNSGWGKRREPSHPGPQR